MRGIPGRFGSRQPVPEMDTETWYEGKLESKLQASLRRWLTLCWPPRAL